MGIGGGLLNVPLMVYGLGRRTRKAIGTSSLLIIPTAAVGFATYVVNLAVRPGGFAWPSDFILIPLFFPIVFVGAYLGSRWGLRALRTRPVALIFILVLFIAAGKLVVDLLRVGPPRGSAWRSVRIRNAEERPYMSARVRRPQNGRGMGWTARMGRTGSTRTSLRGLPAARRPR